MNIRRHLIASAGAGLLTAPFTSFAQAPAPAGKLWRVGVLVLTNREASLDPEFTGAFALGMRDLGYIEGKNLLIEWRFADGDAARLPALAAELMQWRPDVFVAGGNDAPVVLQKLTSTIPIVMASASNPEQIGLVKSLARPGGNTTGLSSVSLELGPKRLQLLLAMLAEAKPKVTRVAALINPTVATRKGLESIEAVSATLGVKIVPVETRTPEEIAPAFAAMRKQQAGAVMVLLNPLYQTRRKLIAELCVQHRLPSMTADTMYVNAGCLMAYGSPLSYLWRRTAYYVDKIFKGAKPADLPVEQPTRIELAINGKTAKALGLTIPQALLISADRVIE